LKNIPKYGDDAAALYHGPWTSSGGQDLWNNLGYLECSGSIGTSAAGLSESGEIDPSFDSRAPQSGRYR